MIPVAIAINFPVTCGRSWFSTRRPRSIPSLALALAIGASRLTAADLPVKAGEYLMLTVPQGGRIATLESGSTEAFFSPLHLPGRRPLKAAKKAIRKADCKVVHVSKTKGVTAKRGRS